MSVVDMCRREKELTQDFVLHIDKWNSMDPDIKTIVSKEWKKIKFLNEDGTAINSEIVNVPNDKGGIYIFLLSPDIIEGLHRYIMYIGRARKKSDFSLRKRCKHYLVDERPKIAFMRETWGKELYFYYLPLEDDDEITAVERELNRVIMPPCNSQIPDQYVNILPASKATFTIV